MAKQNTLLSLIMAAILLASALMVALTPQVQAFDPGGPPAGGAAPSVPTGNWEFINYQPTGGSFSPQNQINKDNVQYLETKWIYPYTTATATTQLAPGNRGSGAPVAIVDGIAYVVLNERRILAIDAATGKLLWNNTYGHQFKAQDEVTKYPWLQRPLSHVHAINYYRERGWLITSSVGSCNLYAVDAKTGNTAWTLTTERICGTNAEFGDPAKKIAGSLSSGYFSSLGTHPPQFFGNIMFYAVGSASGAGGRAFVTAFDMSNPANPRQLYREWVMPPAQGDPNWAISECNKVNGNGWYFEYPRYLESINYPARDREPTYLATKCTDVAADVVRNDWIDMVPSSPTFGKIHTASAISPVWGNYPIDPETGIAYMGWGDQGPYPNLTHRYGPGLHGSGFTAHDVRTGKMVWWFNAIPHDLWDYDCSWGGILGQAAGKKALLKGCKNGLVYVLDTATGKPIWIFDNPTNWRTPPNWNYGVDKSGNPRSPDACCRMTKEHMSKPWMHYPSTGPIIGPEAWTYLESDFAYDGTRTYVVTHNAMRELIVQNSRDFGNPSQTTRATVHPRNSTVTAYDMNTGKMAWTYRIDGAGFRGGIMITGGMVVVYAADGNLKFLDATSGKLLHEKFFGVPVNVMPTIGADKNGKYKIFMHVGGGGGFLFGAGPVDGSLLAFGLPDVLPQPQVITKEVIKEVPKEVVKEVIKEVPKEVIKEVPKEVIKEVPKEVIKEVIK
ncbi:MAG: hypothetical protein FJ358_05615, partial [Thaumarchaeota archaeon]|nr:hypothetical protein [Nitrososphaerota archaeon]